MIGEEERDRLEEQWNRKFRKGGTGSTRRRRRVLVMIPNSMLMRVVSHDGAVLDFACLKAAQSLMSETSSKRARSGERLLL